MLFLLSQIAPVQAWNWTSIAVAVVLVAAVVALVLIALKRFKIQIPEWFIEVIWVVIVTVVVVAAIKFLASL